MMRLLPSDMPVLIFAGGHGTRIAEETQGLIPKPMVDIGGGPMLRHIMEIYLRHGCREFHILAGFQLEVISGWVDHGDMDWLLGRGGSVWVHDTGLDSGTAGRLVQIDRKLFGATPFFLTYGDGLADINLRALVDHHERMRLRKKVLATLTAINPPTRFGAIEMRGGLCSAFLEKRNIEEGWINGGFYVVEQEILDLVSGESDRFEYDILPVIASQERLAAFQHPGYWQCMDTPRDLAALKAASASGSVPWRPHG